MCGRPPQGMLRNDGYTLRNGRRNSLLAAERSRDRGEPDRRAAGRPLLLGLPRTSSSVKTEVPRLIGRDPATIVTAMQGFRAGTIPATVMDRIAKGFSDDEIKAIAAWYGDQKN
jgi:hypothetical protein